MEYTYMPTRDKRDGMIKYGTSYINLASRCMFGMNSEATRPNLIKMCNNL
jgi:hypothetical protein